MQDQAETYLASVVIEDKLSTIEDDEKKNSKNGIMRLSHALKTRL